MAFILYIRHTIKYVKTYPNYLLNTSILLVYFIRKLFENLM